MRPERFDEALPASGSITSVSGERGVVCPQPACFGGRCDAALLSGRRARPPATSLPLHASPLQASGSW